VRVLSSLSAEVMTVDFITVDGTATAGSDYVFKSGTLTFPAGTQSQVVSVPVVSDAVFEADETFSVQLSNAKRGAAAAPITDGTGQGTIVNDDLGTFALTAPSAVEPGKQHTLRLSWDHPVRWRDLDTVELRIRDEEEAVLWVRAHFDDATNTNDLSISRGAAGHFGPAVTLPSHIRWPTPFATLHLGESAVEGSGPTGPTVTVTFSVSFTLRAAGRTYLVEVQATDDTGHVQSFEPAGTVTVHGIQP
jgi:hypothetical protein